MHPPAQSAVGSGNDVLGAYRVGVSEEAIGHELRMLDNICGVTDDARN